MTPNALTVGELRDRIFALAGQAGVKVQQVYVLPAGKGRLANAFAMRGNNVLITDYLLEHLSKREIDAIMAHELAHLKRRDPGKLRGALVLFIATPVGVYLGLSSFTDLNVGPWALPVVMALALMAFYFFSRRRERGADAGAVALTGDAEALITGLAKITALNLMPLQWGKWDERFLTHPSTLRRVQSIAQQSGISPERLQEILESSSSEGERYALPSEERLFSTTFKTQVLAGISWALTAVIVLTPALAAYLITRAGWEGLAKEAAYLGGLTATLACYLAAGNYALLWGCRGLQRRLRERMEREGVMPEREDGLFVGFAPASSPRLYEGFSDWDIGFLFIEEDRLCYLGEQVRFALRRDQVSAIQLGPGGPGWWREPRIYVTWRSEECGAGGIFNLSATSARSVRQLGRETRALARQLRAWSEQPSPLAGVPSSLPELGAPAVGGVTSVSPRTLINARVVLWSMLVMAALAAGVSVLMSLPFDPDQGGAAWYVIAVTTVASIFQWWPYLIYREPDSAKKATIPAPDAPEV